MKAKFIDHDIPVIVGEFAAQRRGAPLSGDDLALHLKSRLYYHQYVVRSAVGHGLRPFFWDVGNEGGVFNRTNNTVSDQADLTALQQGALGVAP